LNFRFEHIQFLVGLAALPLLVLLFIWVISWKKKTQKKIGDPALVAALVMMSDFFYAGFLYDPLAGFIACGLFISFVVVIANNCGGSTFKIIT